MLRERRIRKIQNVVTCYLDSFILSICTYFSALSYSNVFFQHFNFLKPRPVSANILDEATSSFSIHGCKEASSDESVWIVNNALYRSENEMLMASIIQRYSCSVYLATYINYYSSTNWKVTTPFPNKKENKFNKKLNDISTWEHVSMNQLLYHVG